MKIPAFAFFLTLVHFSAIAQLKQETFEKANRLYFHLVSAKQVNATKSFSDSDRTEWHYVPTVRTGIALKELDMKTSEMMFDFLSTLLSESGFVKTKEIIELEDILRESEGRPVGDSYRDKGKYYFNFFDKPSKTGPWAVSFEGHHLSLNFTFVGEQLSGTPLFMGANPAEVRIEKNKGKKVLKEEEELGRKLVKSLDEDQQSKAIISKNAPYDIETESATSISIKRFDGIVYTELNSQQKQVLKSLVNLYLGKLEKDVSEKYLNKIEKWGWESLFFAWTGGTEPGQGHYYKITGPTLLIE